MPSFAAVLFDCDGVVVDSERLSNQVMRDDLASRGLNLSLDEAMETFVGGSLEGVAAHAAQLGANVPDNWPQLISAKIFDVLRHDVIAVPGIEAVLDRLDMAGVPYAMGSNGPVRKMELTLGVTGLLPRFAGRLFSGEDMGVPKPAPDVYLAAARALGCLPAECVVIEDSPSGARAAKAAGMRCFGCTRDTPRDRLASLVAATFDDMADLPGLLGI